MALVKLETSTAEPAAFASSVGTRTVAAGVLSDSSNMSFAATMFLTACISFTSVEAA
ncbi:hypothetical protein ACUQRY_001257 [Enterobacter hormaechei]